MILSVNNSMKNLEIVLPEEYFVVATVEVSKRVNKADLDEAAVESNEMFYVLCSMFYGCVCVLLQVFLLQALLHYLVSFYLFLITNTTTIVTIY